ncbi:Putative glutamine amidotransferase-like protein [Tolypocladium paradoxum]|uniref:Glutamine amidotransferase-like protein n=1 Tax=Tolypocladium paradoxum TaxID=94208 RepID=A0A2S4KSH5_9HYPO|nr:Putative glutamine amidotransferase-like protein [Tolypocladium paradoxum]
MNPTFLLGVLECDTPVPAVQEARGSYGEVFRQLLAQGLNDLGEKGRNTQLCLSKWDVVGSQEYPKTDEVDGILLTGRSSSFPRPFTVIAETLLRGLIHDGHEANIGHCAHLVQRWTRPPRGWEISVDKINVSKEGRDLLGISSLELHQMHRDAILEVPRGLVNLGSSPSCAIQGLYQPGRVLSFQAHPEFDGFIMADLLKSRHEQKIFDDQIQRWHRESPWPS